MTYNGLPLFRALVDDGDDTGMLTISLVEMPAVQRDFLAYSAGEKMIRYSISDEEKRRVFGLVMLCDVPIFRRGEKGDEYYIVYDRPTIERMAEKFLAEHRQNDVDLNHSFEIEDGIRLTEIFIKDSARGLCPTGFEEVPDGSLFAEYHVLNDTVWAGIKDGTYKGFSLSGVFNVESFSNHNEEEKKDNMKMERIKTMLRRMLAEFGEVVTDRGVLIWDGGDDLKAGDVVRLLDGEGREAEAPEGDYITDDGKTIHVDDGRVESITDPKAEIAPEEIEENQENQENAEEEGAGEDEKDARIAELEAEVAEKDTRIEEIETKMSEKDTRIAELEARIAELEKKPLGKAATDEFESAARNPEAEKMRKRGYRW